MKIKSRRTKSFPGDTYIAIEVHLDNGHVWQPFGVWPRNDRLYSDIDGKTFKTLTEAKKLASEMYHLRFSS